MTHVTDFARYEHIQKNINSSCIDVVTRSLGCDSGELLHQHTICQTSATILLSHVSNEYEGNLTYSGKNLEFIARFLNIDYLIALLAVTKMTDKAILKEKTTAHVRALLMSAPVPLTINELKRDYFNFIGEQLRYRDMGFATLEDFLR